MGKIFLIAVDLKEESGHIEDHAFFKIIAQSEKVAKQMVWKELKDEFEFESTTFEDFNGLIAFCHEIDTTTPSQEFYA